MSFISRFSYLLRCELSEYSQQAPNVSHQLRSPVSSSKQFQSEDAAESDGTFGKNPSHRIWFRAGEKCSTCKKSRQLDAEAFQRNKSMGGYFLNKQLLVEVKTCIQYV